MEIKHKILVQDIMMHHRTAVLNQRSFWPAWLPWSNDLKDPTYLQRLRLHAEHALMKIDQTGGNVADLSPEDAAHLLHELNVYRTELELQNQELLSSQHEALLAHERYKTLFDAMPLPALVVGKTGQIHKDNQAARQVLGAGPGSDGCDFRLSTALRQPERLRVMEALMMARKGKPYICEDVLIDARDTSIRNMDIYCVALPDDQYQEPYSLLLLLDKTAEQERREAESRMASVFASATEAIIVTDAETRIKNVNPAFERMSGRTEQEVRGSKVSALKSGRHSSEFYKSLWTLLSETGQWQGEITNQHVNGSFYNVWATIVALQDKLGVTNGYMSVQTDITQLQHAQTSISRLTSYDSLTKLPNRVLFEDRLAQQLSQAKRSGRSFSIFFLDLDRFKEVNDTQGHPVGDLLLQKVASRLLRYVRAQDTVARIGGDEFLVLLPDTSKESAITLAMNILQKLGTPMELTDGLSSFEIQASIGVATWPSDGETAEKLMRNADTAMYVAKMNGRNGVSAYTAAMSEKTMEAFSIQQSLIQALEKGELRVYFQPTFCIKTRTVCGAEALVRWVHPDEGLILPNKFLPVALQSGLMRRIDRWVMNAVIRQLNEWEENRVWPADWKLSFNQTVQDIREDSWMDCLRNYEKKSVNLACLEVELTEGMWMQPTVENIQRLNELKELGIHLAIDDFGTGYSNLAYLSQLPVATLKIDRGFIQNIEFNDLDRSMVGAIVDIGRRLGFKLIAEGVETAGQCIILDELNCQYGQGFLVAQAMTAEEFAKTYLLK